MLRGKLLYMTCTLALLASVGCSQNTEEPNADGGGEDYVLATEPEGAKGVLAVRKDAKDGDEVVVVGRIGGSADPWVKGLSAFTIVDPKLSYCTEEGCLTPWDYCCEPDVADATVLIKFVDENGKPIKKDAKTMLGVKELDMVVVKGKVQRDKDRTSIQATGLHVRK